MKRFLLLALVCFMLVSFTSAVMAQEIITVDTQSSSVFLSYGSGIGQSSGYIICSAWSDLNGMYSQSITMELQKYVNGSWIKVTSWYASDYSVTMDLRESYPATTGLYRVKSTHVAGGESPRTSYSGNYSVN